MHIDTKQSRRAFLQRAAHLSAAGAAAPLLGSLGLLSEAAAAATGTDYKALVCVFQYGGNDHLNTLIPYDEASHADYMAARPRIGVPRGHLASTALTTANNMGGRQFAFHPSLKALTAIFAQGKIAPLLNIGALVEPTTKAQYLNKSVRLPPKLFSHNDQQSYMQAFAAEGADAGWGGRMGDLMQAGNGTSALSCISLCGRSLYLSGNSTMPYTAQPSSVNGLLSGGSLFGSRVAFDAMRALMTSDQNPSWIAQEHARVATRAVALGEKVSTALARAPDASFTTFTPGNKLSDQLKMVARLISVAPNLGLKRQVFFVSQGGYDTHSGQAGTHPGLLATLGAAMSEFHEATVQLGIEAQVTTFTASDFGRSAGDNGDGSDHGWGSTHFVMGGAVKGGRIYGTPPAVGIGTNDAVVGGRMLPTTSIQQMAATMALWFGVPASDLPMILPNLPNFNPSQWNLGFL
jgi:uncharacterized protein (DUF1501 family)